MEKVTERLTRSGIVHLGKVHEKLSEISIDAYCVHICIYVASFLDDMTGNISDKFNENHCL